MGASCSAGRYSCSLGKREVGQVHSSFDSLDTNQDGVIYFEDIPKERKSDAQVLNVVFHLVHILSSIDLDGDGKISRDEYQEYQRVSGTEDGSKKLLFASWDMDHDGRVTTAELVEAMEANNPNHGRALSDALETMGSIAGEGENSFSLDQFLNVYRR